MDHGPFPLDQRHEGENGWADVDTRLVRVGGRQDGGVWSDGRSIDMDKYWYSSVCTVSISCMRDDSR